MRRRSASSFQRYFLGFADPNPSQKTHHPGEFSFRFGQNLLHVPVTRKKHHCCQQKEEPALKNWQKNAHYAEDQETNSQNQPDNENPHLLEPLFLVITEGLTQGADDVAHRGTSPDSFNHRWEQIAVRPCR